MWEVVRALTYYTVGPAQEIGGFGYGTGQWSGTASGPATTTLVSTIAADAAVTSVTLSKFSSLSIFGNY